MIEGEIFANKEILFLSVDEIMTNPYQPRKTFDKKELEELAESIREHGVLQPISVRLINGKRYELVAGERRLKASRLAEKEKIPALIVNITDKQSAMFALIENLQRKNLNYIEEAEGLNNLLIDYKLTQEELAEKIGKSQSAIANKLRLLKLPVKSQKLLIEKGLSERHARAFLKITNEEVQLDLIEKVSKNRLSVKKTEEMIEKIIEIDKELNNPGNKRVIKRHIRDIRLFTNTIKQAVDIMVQSGVNTDYDMKEIEDGYEILIKINTLG